MLIDHVMIVQGKSSEIIYYLKDSTRNDIPIIRNIWIKRAILSRY